MPTQMATDLDLFQEFDKPKARRAPSDTSSDSEVRQFEEIFGMASERTPSGSSRREHASGNGAVFKGRVPEAQLRALYAEFARTYLQQRNQPLPVSFEQLAVMVEQRRAQIHQKFPGVPISIAVVVEGGKVLLKVKAAADASVKPA